MTVRQTAIERAIQAGNQHPAGSYESPAITPQTTALLPFELETFLDEQSGKTNAMYALSNIFRHAAFAEAQVLNVLEHQVENELGIMQPENMRSYTLDNLQYFNSILNCHVRHIRDTLRSLTLKEKRFATAGDPSVTTDMTESLIGDFQELLNRALDLCGRCKDGMGIMQSRAIVMESRKAIDQAESLKKLTMMASFFVPLSFSTSVFGMNFKEFGQGQLSVRLFAAVAVPVALLSFCFYMWDIWANICAFFRTIRRFMGEISERRFWRWKQSLI